MLLEIIILLFNGDKRIPQLSEEIGSSPAAILPKFRILEERGFVDKTEGIYSLTSLGRIIAWKISLIIKDIEAKNAHLDLETLFHNNEVGGLLSSTSTNDRNSSLLMQFKKNATEIQSLFRSTILTKIILSLMEDGKTRNQIRDITLSESSNLRPILKQMRERGLIFEDGYEYILTKNGRFLAKEIEDVILTIAVISKHLDFWKNHYLIDVPDSALITLGDLIEGEIICDTSTESLKAIENFLDIIEKAEYIFGVSAWAQTGVADVLSKRAIKGIPIELVISPELAFTLSQEPYLEKIEKLKNFKNFRIFVTEIPIKIGLTVTNSHLSCGFYFRDGKVYDPIQDICCTSQKSLEWGERVYKYYRDRSVPIERYIRKIQKGLN
jgi:predicted transcriptional regulator